MKNPNLLQTVSEIKKLHSEILDAARGTLDKAIKIGERLMHIKAGLKHGEWLPWLQNNLMFSERTARNYCQCYEERERLKTETVSDLTAAYRLMSEWKTEPEPLPPTELSDWLDRPISAGEYFSLPEEKLDRPLSDFDYIGIIEVQSRLRAGIPITPRQILELRARADERTKLEEANEKKAA